MKKFLLPLIVVVAVAVGAIGKFSGQSQLISGQNPFPDTNIFSIEGQAAAKLFELGIIEGYPDGTFKGYLPVNRAQAAKILLIGSGIPVDQSLKNNGRFRDVAEGEWYVPYVMSAENAGVLQGYPDGSFRPAQRVNTVEFLKMLSLAFQAEVNLPYYFVDVPPEQWFAAFAGISQKYNLFPERQVFLYPAAQLSRRDVVVAIFQYLTNSGRLGGVVVTPPPPPDMPPIVPSSPSPPAASPSSVSVPEPSSSSVASPIESESSSSPSPPAGDDDSSSSEADDDQPPVFSLPTGGPRVIDITAEEWKFTPEEVTVEKDDEVSLRLKSLGGIFGFAVPTLGISEVIIEDEEVIVPLPTDKKGTHYFFCAIPCGEGREHMFGSIIID